MALRFESKEGMLETFDAMKAAGIVPDREGVDLYQADALDTSKITGPWTYLVAETSEAAPRIPGTRLRDQLAS